MTRVLKEKKKLLAKSLWQPYKKWRMTGCATLEYEGKKIQRKHIGQSVGGGVSDTHPEIE